MNSIKNIDQNRITNINGKEQWFYRLRCPDLEQLTGPQIEGVVNDLKKDLSSLADTDTLNFYFIDDRIYLNTSLQNVNLSSIEKVPEPNIAESILEMDDIYSHVEIKDDYLVVNSTYYRFLNIEEFPGTLDLCGLLEFGDYFLRLKKVHPEKAKQKLDLSRKINLSAFSEPLRDIKGEASHGESESLLEQVIYGDEDLFESEIWFVLKADSVFDLKKKTHRCLNNLVRRGFKVLIETVGLKYAFEAYLFSSSQKLERSILLHASFVINTLPLTEDFLMKEGVTLKSKSLCDIHFDLFNKNALNYNAICVGPPGSGKSFFAAKLVFELLKEDAKVVILDRGGSYKKLTHYKGGHVFKNSFNPLHFKDPIYLKELIVSNIPKEEITELTKGKLLRLLKEIDLSQIDSFPILLKIIEKTFPDIPYYFEEVLSYFDNEKGELYDFTYIDLAKFPENILSPLLVYLLQYINSIEGKKVFLMDECHHLLERNPLFVSQKFRELRKQMGSAIALTQNFNDFIATIIGKAIASSSFNHFFFRQSVHESEFLDSFDIDRISNVRSHKGKYSEGYLKTEAHRKTFRYYPTNLEYEIFTSDYVENQRMERFFSDHNNYFPFNELIEKWTEVKYG